MTVNIRCNKCGTLYTEIPINTRPWFAMCGGDSGGCGNLLTLERIEDENTSRTK
jgi:hypothetical protein